MNRKDAEIELKRIFGFDCFYDEQWETIDLLLKGKRVLLIEKTGFGKSLCFQFPAVLFSGLTIIFSPLIALMRDQVKALNSKGIMAKYINSEQSEEENFKTIQEAIEGKLKILYIAPERQENSQWIEATFKMRLSMIVIDEAHTISVWGHDFRPAFRRIINLVKLLPQNLPVLATTATATYRVQKDIETQISGDLHSIRGDLIRENFQLYVIKVKSDDEKLLWLADNLKNFEGTGIIYVGTRINTVYYSRWLEYLGISSVEYNARLDAKSRIEIENGLMENRWKVVISTNALGMGIDKPDIRFIIHTQIPASPIHYYQEIGRAGRDGKPTKLILFYNYTKDKYGVEEDYKLPKSFIENSRPHPREYYKVLDVLKEDVLSENEIIRQTNLKKNQIRVIKADLIDQGIIKEVKYGRDKRYEYQFNAKSLDIRGFDKLREEKYKELNSMVEYVNTKSSRMKFLCNYLGDTHINEYKNCDNTNLRKYSINNNSIYSNMLKDFKEGFFPVLSFKSPKSNLFDGIAASYYGLTVVGNAIHRSKYENGGDFPDFLVNLSLKAYRKAFGDRKFDLILFVPPTESGNLVRNFSRRISYRLEMPLSYNLVKTSDTKPQKIFQNSYLKKDNVSNKFDYLNPCEIMNKTILLIDDVFDSGATIKEIAYMLTKYGAKTIAPLVIAKTSGGDI